MSKDLPYFRFYPSEWLEGDITLENHKTQALFIQICSYYWKKDCEVDLEFIKKRIIKNQATLKQCLNNLIESNIIKVSDNQSINITFLDEQYDLLSEKRQKLVEAGRIGGQASVKRRSTIAQANRIKINNRKDKKEFIAPTSDEITAYGKEKGYNLDGKKIHEYYTELKWCDSTGKKVRNWKSKILAVWCKDENKIKEIRNEFIDILKENEQS